MFGEEFGDKKVITKKQNLLKNKIRRNIIKFKDMVDKNKIKYVMIIEKNLNTEMIV